MANPIKWPIGQPVNANVDDTSNDSQMEAIVDGMHNDLRHLIRRPGLGSEVDSGGASGDGGAVVDLDNASAASFTVTYQDNSSLIGETRDMEWKNGYLAVGTDLTGNDAHGLHIFTRSGNTLTEKDSGINTDLSAGIDYVAWNDDASYLATSNGDLRLWKNDAGVLTEKTVNLLPGSDTSWAPGQISWAGDYLVADGSSGDDGMRLFKWDGADTLTEVWNMETAYPATAGIGGAGGVAISPNTNYVVACFGAGLDPARGLHLFRRDGNTLVEVYDYSGSSDYNFDIEADDNFFYVIRGNGAAAEKHLDIFKVVGDALVLKSSTQTGINTGSGVHLSIKDDLILITRNNADALWELWQANSGRTTLSLVSNSSTNPDNLAKTSVAFDMDGPNIYFALGGGDDAGAEEYPTWSYLVYLMQLSI